jgi:hypothetical protein
MIEIRLAMNGWTARYAKYPTHAELGHRNAPDDVYVFEKWESLQAWLLKEIGPKDQEKPS